MKHNLWQVLHIEADATAGRAKVFVNGKNIGTVPVIADGFDAVELGYTNGSDGEFSDIYIDTTLPRYAKYWTGKVHRLRFDPVDMGDRSFDVDCIEFLGYTDEQENNCVTVDGVKLSVPVSHVEKTASECYIVALPENGVFSANNMYYEYNRHTGRLYIKTTDETEFVFTVGSDRVLVNGIEQTLERAVTLYDGVPVLPFRFILDRAGHEYISDKTGFHIFVRTKAGESGGQGTLLEETDGDGKFGEFENAGDAEGWTVSNAAAFVSDGALTVFPSQVNNTNGYDPYILKSVSVSADKYTDVEVKVNCTPGVNRKGEKKIATCLYFTTDTDDRLDEKKVLFCYESDAEKHTDGSLVFRFKVTENENWHGVIQKLRFDLPENNGIYSIDYIRLMPNPDYVEPTTEKEQTAKEDSNKPIIGSEPFERVESAPNADSYEFNDKKLSGFGVLNAEYDFDDDNLILTALPSSAATTGYDVGILKSGLSIKAETYTMLVVRMKPEFSENVGGAALRTISKIYFTTAEDGARDEYKTLKCDIKNAYEDGDGYYVFVYATSGNSLWSGTITSILFDPTDNNGVYTIDYIRFSDGKAPEANASSTGSVVTADSLGREPFEHVQSAPNEDSYEFNDKKLSGFGVLNAEHTFDNDNLILTASSVSYSATGYDVGLLKTSLNIPAEKYGKIAVRMKPTFLENVGTAALKTVTKIYFTTDTDGARDEYKTLKCDIKNAYEDGDGYYVFVYTTSDNSLWSGKITSVLFDPTDNNGIYTVDYIRFV